MKNSRKLALILIAVMIIGVISTACGSKAPETLEAYIAANEGEQGALDSIVSDDPNAALAVSGNTLEITYTIDDDSITKEILDEALDGLGDAFKDIITDLEQETGIEGIDIKVTYVTSDGSEITTKTFE